jgi:two-component system, cell cycle sensor histidine kinase and response regulator CckA
MTVIDEGSGARGDVEPLAERLQYLESMERIHLALQTAADLESAMGATLAVVRGIFDCDRASLVEGVGPARGRIWRLRCEDAAPEWPGASHSASIGPAAEDIFERAVAQGGVWRHDDASGASIPEEGRERYGVKAALSVALRQPPDNAWVLVLHHCRFVRAWTDSEERLFERVAQRVGDALENLLAHRALSLAESRQQDAQRLARIGHWEMDFDAGCLTPSAQAREIFGFPPGEAPLDIASSREHWSRRIHAEDRARVLRGIYRSVANGTAYDLEYRYTPDAGGVRHLRSLGTPFEITRGGANRWFGTVQDLSQLRRMEAELRQSQKLEAIGHLAGGLAHDFNNLLTVILGYSGVLRTRLAHDPGQLRLVEEILRCGERAADVVSQLLTFSRKQTLRVVRVDLSALLAGWERLIRPLLEEDIVLSIEMEPETPSVKVDPVLLEQALTNLAINARDAMPDGGRVRVTIRAVEVGGEQPRFELAAGRYVQISVEDDGTGMDEATRAHIFEPFFTTKAVGKGTGLGLAMVYGFAKQSAGDIEVSSTPGGGSRFDLLLPVCLDLDTETATEASDDKTAPPGGSETVLLVEDERSVRKLARELLENVGYRVLEAADGDEALALARRHKVDLLVTDVVMPRMKGPELVQRMRERWPELPVVLMSGHTGRSDTPSEPLLLKPFTPAQLATRVRAALDTDGG